MYRITYKHRYSEEIELYNPLNNDLMLFAAKLSIGCGKAGELTMNIPIGNPERNNLIFPSDEIIVYRNDVEIFRGRPITKKKDFNLTGTVICEGILTYLYDTFADPFNFNGSPKEFLELIISQHNSQVSDIKKFKVGVVTVEDANDTIVRASEGYDRCLNVLFDKLTNSTLGGYLRVRHESDGNYIDYVKKYGTVAKQVVQLGENILDIAQEVEYGEMLTAILPLGAKDDETGKYLTVESVNNGSKIIKNDEYVEVYDFKCEKVIWEDVTEPSNLLKKAKTYLEQAKNPIESITVKAIDLAWAFPEIEYINLGDMVGVLSAPHGISQTMELTEWNPDLLNPQQDTLVFGQQQASMTEQKASSERKTANQLEDVSVNVDKINATYASIAYISSKYITSEKIATTYATIENLDAEKARIDDLETHSLTADSAVITELTSDNANIKQLLAGYAGTGSIVTIHITGQNAVFDDAVITDAMIASLSAGKIKAGTIYSSLVKIASDENENLLIDGSTIQIKDNNGTVRVQIGKDGNDDYSMYIWGADGKLLWRPEGITGEGIGEGTIKDINVSDNANINGSKLDIQSVASELSDDGTLTVSGAQVYIDNTQLSTLYQSIITKQEDFQKQLDNEVSNYVGSVDPTMENMPVIEWLQAENPDAELARNVGKMYYNTESGKAIRFTYEGYYTDENNVFLTDENGNKLCCYYWLEIKDSETAKALATANQALEKASGVNDLLIKDYSTTETVQGMFQTNNKEIRGELSRDYVTKANLTDKNGTFMGSYATVESVNTTVSAKTDEVKSEMQGIYLTQTEYQKLKIGSVNMILNSEDLSGIAHDFFDYLCIDENSTILTDENGNYFTM